MITRLFPHAVFYNVDRILLSHITITFLLRHIIGYVRVQEAMQCVDELEQATMLYVFVRVGVESTLERSQITREHMGQLFHQLLQAGSLSKSQFFKG